MAKMAAHDFGTITPASTLQEIVTIFRAAREWSCEMDERLRADGHVPASAALGIPVSQVDAIIVVLEQVEQRIAFLEGENRRRITYGLLLACAALALAVINIAAAIVWFIFR